MSDADIHDQVLRLIEVAQEQLAAFARDSYETVGRGAILIAMPPLAPATSALIPTELVYHPATEFERLFDELDDAARAYLGEAGLADAHVVIRMMATYDPTTQAVLVVTIEGHPDHHQDEARTAVYCRRVRTHPLRDEATGRD